MTQPPSMTPVLLPATATEADWREVWVSGRGAHVVQGGESGLRDRAVALSRRRLKEGVRAALVEYVDPPASRTVFQEPAAEASKAISGWIESDARWNALPSRLADLIATVAEELVGNAARHAQTATAQPLLVELAWGPTRCGISVVDSAGALTVTDVQPILARAAGGEFETDPGRGAGLGLHLAASSANQFVIDVEPGRRTEIIAVFETGGAYRGYRRAGRAFDLYGAETTPTAESA